MLSQYSNIEEINSAKKAIAAKRFKSEDLGVFKKALYEYQSVELTSNNSSNELHIYAGDSYITGKQKIELINFSDPIYDDDGYEIQLSAPVSINISQELLNLKLTNGNFKVVINFFENIIGSYNKQHLAIDEISPDRTEVRLKAIDERDPAFLLAINNYINNVQQTSLTNDPYNCYLLNFSRNQTIKYVNSVVVGKYLFVKLYEPLGKEYKKNFKCWVVREKKNPYIDNIQAIEKVNPIQFNVMQGTNWYASAEQETSNATALKTWNDLLGSSLQTSQQIIDNYFSGSLGGIKLNIDYTDFNNFVFYSSAAERVSNFKYKLELLEYYSQQSSSISQLSGSIAESNALENNILSSNLIGGFDDFEKFLYYESSSGLFNNDVPVEEPVVAEVTGSYITPIPKSNNTRPYTIVSVTSSMFENWYSELFDKASIYDNRNNNRIIRAVPEFMLLDENNEQLSTFVNMLGQHYDILYTYINSMTLINSREEHPKIGMPNELLYSVAKQFGWKLTNGAQSEDLWKYTLGTDEFGVPLTGSNSVGDAAVPLQDVTFATWRRIVNNIPGLLKTKGTKRSIQALLACYGIPQSLITIQEYGGPRIKRPPRYEKHNFDYSLDLIQNTAGTVEVSYDSSVNTGIVKSAQLRFRTENVLTNPTLPGTMNIFSIGGHDVTITFTRGTLGTIGINGNQSDEIELFDGEYTTALLRQKDSSNLEILAKRSKFGKIVATVSASDTGVFALPSAGQTAKMIVGGTSGGSRLQGQVQELRLWSSSLADAPYANHTKAPSAYDGNINAYEELIFRSPLTQRINHAETASIGGVQPNQFLNTITADFTGWTNDTPYDSVEETYFFDGISLGAGSFDDNKIRLESTITSSFLNTENRVTTNEFDTAPLDSEQLGVFYSPQIMINEDIIAQLGFTVLDDLIGDPSNIDPYAYPDLVNTSKEYWKKYEDRNDMNAYLRIFSLFDLSFFKQVEQLLPARADKTLGVLIQPTILERSRDKVLTRVSKESLTFHAEIDLDDDELEAETKQLEPVIPMHEDFITGSTIQLEPEIDINHDLMSAETIQLEDKFKLADGSDTRRDIFADRDEFSGTVDAFDPESYLSSSRNEYLVTLDAFDPESYLSSSRNEYSQTLDLDIVNVLTSSYGDLNVSMRREILYEVSSNKNNIDSFLSLVRPATIKVTKRSFDGLAIANRNPFEGTKYVRQYLLYNKITNQYITGSTPYWETEGVSPFITASRLSEFKQKEYKFPKTDSYLGNLSLGGSTKTLSDFGILKNSKVVEIPTNTGIGIKSNEINLSWIGLISGKKIFKRTELPILDMRIKVLSIVGNGTNSPTTAMPLAMIGWFPGDDTMIDANGNVPEFAGSALYARNEYAIYFSTNDIKIYRGGTTWKDASYNSTSPHPVQASNILQVNDIIHITMEAVSTGVYICVKRNRAGVTTTHIDYNLEDIPANWTSGGGLNSPRVIENNLRFGSSFRGGLNPNVEIQSIRIDTIRSYRSFEYRPAEYQDYSPRGIVNSRFEGTKISSPDFNVPSKDTPDGKPVVEIEENSGNRIITKPPGIEGNFEIRQ